MKTYQEMIRALDCCLRLFERCGDCPYNNERIKHGVLCRRDLEDDVKEVLIRVDERTKIRKENDHD